MVSAISFSMFSTKIFSSQRWKFVSLFTSSTGFPIVSCVRVIRMTPLHSRKFFCLTMGEVRSFRNSKSLLFIMSGIRSPTYGYQDGSVYSFRVTRSPFCVFIFRVPMASLLRSPMDLTYLIHARRSKVYNGSFGLR